MDANKHRPINISIIFSRVGSMVWQ